MFDYYCIDCGRGMSSDEAALNKKYINRACTKYLCPECLARKFGLTAEHLRDMIKVFQKQGCTLFSPLKENEQ